MTDALTLPPQLTVRSLSPVVGAEITGLDLTRPLDTDTTEALRALYLRYHLLLVRGLDLSENDQARFARLFGETSLRERNKEKLERRDNQYVSNTRPDGIFGKGELDFHMDQLFLETPLKALILYAIEVPETGGETHFVNSQAVYESMPEALKSRIEGLYCRHTRAYDSATTKAWNVIDASDDAPTWVHPLTWSDARTGKRSIWINKLTTVGIEGMSPAESSNLINEIRQYLYNDALSYRHEWRPGDLILWDNHVLQHARTPFDPAATRTLRRTALV